MTCGGVGGVLVRGGVVLGVDVVVGCRCRCFWSWVGGDVVGACCGHGVFMCSLTCPHAGYI